MSRVTAWITVHWRIRERNGGKGGVGRSTLSLRARASSWQGAVSEGGTNLIPDGLRLVPPRKLNRLRRSEEANLLAD